MLHVNPFKGLHAFDETDAVDFHGRDELVGQLCARIATVGTARLTLVVGGPAAEVERHPRRPRSRGSRRQGGTRMVRHHDAARCVPVQGTRRSSSTGRRQRHRRPGHEPAKRVDDRGRRGGGSRSGGRLVLLVIDQFEELFTLTSMAEQAAFLDGDRDRGHGPRQPDPRRRHAARRLLRSAARRPTIRGTGR